MSFGIPVRNALSIGLGGVLGLKSGFSILNTAIARFDPTSFVGNNPVTEWQNRNYGGSVFDYDVPVGTGANLSTLDSGVALLPGASGDKLTAPDRAAQRGTGDFSWIFEITAFDWTPGSTSLMGISGANAATSSTNWRIRLETNGIVNIKRPTGGTSRNFNSSVAISTSGGDKLFIKILFDQDNGAGASQVDFSTSTDGIVYSALGVAQTVANTGAGNSDTTGLTLGSLNDGGSPIAGKIHRIRGFSDKTATTEVFDCDPNQADVGVSIDTGTFASGGDTYTIAGNTFVNNTGHTGLYSRGSVVFESTAGQLLTPPLTIYDVFHCTLAAPGADQYIYDSRSNAAASISLRTDQSNSDKYTMNQGSDIALSQSFANGLQVYISQLLGTSSSKLTAGAGSVTGDAGSENYDFGAIFGALGGGLTMQGLYLERLIFDSAHSAGQIADVETLLGAKYSI